MISFLRRKPELTQAQFFEHWTDVHARILERNAELLGIVRYSIVKATEPEIMARFNPALDPTEQYDGVAELWLDSVERLTRPPSPEEVSVHAELEADELKFVDRARSYRLVGEEVTILDETE